jgi:O-antigen/teichoic acid export membrane protein
MGLVTVVGLWLTPFLLHRIGQHDLGLWLLVNQILGYLMLLDFGVVALLPREAAYSTGRTLQGGDASDLARTIGRFRRIVRWQVPLAALAAVIVWVALPVAWAPLRQPLLAVLAVFVLTFPLRIYHAALQGLQDLAFLGRVQLLAWAAGTGVTVLLVLHGGALNALVAGAIVTQLTTAVASGLRLRSAFPHGWSSTPGPVPWSEARTLLGRSTWVSLSQLAQVFLNGTDVLLLGKMLGPAAVVPYSCTGKLVNVLTNQPYLLMQSAAPALSEMRTAESRERLAQVTTALTRGMLIVSGAVVCVIAAVNQGFVSWWIGANQFGGWWLTIALLAMMLLRHLSTTAVYALFAFGHERRLALTSFADGAVTLMASALLIWRLGPVGAPLGGLIGVTCVSLPANFIGLSRETGLTVARLALSLRGWAVRFAIGAASCIAFGRMIQPTGVVSLGLTTVAAFAVYVALMLPLALEPPLGQYIRGTVARLLPWLPGLAVQSPGRSR